MEFNKNEVCVSDSVSSTSASSKSSDWQHVFQEIRREVDLLRKDDHTMALARRDAQAGACTISSSNVSTMWTKVKDTKYLSLIKGSVVVYSSESFLLLYNLATGKRSVFCPQPVEKNNGVGYHIGHPSLDVVAVAEIAVRPRIFLVQYPSMETVDTVSDYSTGRYDSLAFSGGRMLLTLKAGLKLNIAIWDWKTKFRYFNIERESYSHSLSLRGSSSSCLFSLLCLGKPAKLYLWEMSIFTDIVSLFSKHCSEDKDLDLTDQCLLNGNLYAVDVCGDIYKANKESSDHVKFLKIIENEDSVRNTSMQADNDFHALKGPFIVGTALSGLAVYGPAQCIKYYKKQQGNWICEKVTPLKFPLNHLVAAPSDDFLIGWDNNGLLKIGQTVEVLEDRRIMTDYITCVAVIHPEDRIVATLLSKKKIQFWTIDQGFYIAEYEFEENGSGKNMVSHPMVPYLVVTMCQFGDLQIIDVQNIRRPRLHKIISLTLDPLSYLEFNPRGNLIIASGSSLESIYLVGADPTKGFEVHRCAITRHPFSCFATIMGATGVEWIVLLLSNYRKSTNRFCELLTVPGLSEFIKVDLGQTYSQILTCYYNPSVLIAALREDVILTTFTIDTKKGRIGDKQILEGRHVVPPVSMSLERFHAVSFGGRDGYLVLYTDQHAILTIAPHRFSGILWATFATKTRCFITLARDYSLTCFSLLISCEHDDKEHVISYMPYKYLPYSKAKMFKRIFRDCTPWDELEDNQKKIHIYKKGVVRIIGKTLSPQELLRILNTASKESKIHLIREAAGHFDQDIIIDYIRKWITHFRTIAAKFVTYNEYLESERPQEMIPWEKIREVESRAYSEYKNHYEETLSKFMKGVETSINRWTTAYNRIVETTWKSMAVQSKACKMIFRDFECQNFGFKEDYNNIYNMVVRRIDVSHMDNFLHSAKENFIWDARFEVFENYWQQYYRYLREGVVETIDEIIAAEKIQDEYGVGGEEDNYEIQNLSRFLEEDSDLGVSAVFKRRMLEGNLQSYTSMQRLGTLKRTEANNLILSRKDGMGRLSELDTERENKESDESLFYDSEEENLAKKPVSLKRYKKHKRRMLKKIITEYPYMDEFTAESFKSVFRIPSTFPEDCVFLRPAAHLSSTAYFDNEESLDDISLDYKRNTIFDNNFLRSVRQREESEPDLNKVQTADTAIDTEEEDKPVEKEFEDMKRLIAEQPSEKMKVAKHMVDSDYEAEMLELAKQQALLKKSKKKKEVIPLQAESTEEEIPEPVNKDDDNRRKRIRTYKLESGVDKIEISILNEEILQKEKNMPRNPFAISDLSRLYLILDVDILIESNRKKRKRRKSSLDREAIQVIEHKQAESKNERMTRLLSMAQDHQLRHFSLLARFQDGEEDNASEDSQDVIDMGKARAFIHGGMLENDKELRRKVIIVGDVVRFKKRRLILGKIKKRSSDEKLVADLEKLGIQGPILPPNYVVSKRFNIHERLKEKLNILTENDDEIKKDHLALYTSSYDMQDLLWLDVALKMFDTTKGKKTSPGDTPGTTTVMEELEPEPVDLPSMVKTKVSIMSALKGFVEGEKESQNEVVEKKERPRLLATANISTVEDGMEFLTAGTVAGNFISTGSLKNRNQLTAPTTLKLVVDIAHDTKAIYDIFEYFNQQFEKLRTMKDTIMRLIQQRQQKYDFYINEIRLACKQEPLYPEMPPAVYSPRENPEMMITVSDNEVPVSRYYSLSELSLKRRLEEEEALRKRKPKPDPFKLEALQIMMDGVVERRWEDELRKEIPYPKALVGKEPEEWDVDEIAMNIKYEHDVKFHDSERLRYKQILAEKINQEIEGIRELHLGFDLRVKQMSCKLTEFIQIGKELKMFNFRRFRDKAMQMAFLAAAERARTFNEATKASVDQIESLVKVLGKKMKNHKAKMAAIKKKKEQREEKLEETLKKMGVISADRSFVIQNYIRPSFVINPKFIEVQNLLQTVLETFDTLGDANTHLAPAVSEFYKDVTSSLKRNVPQKLTKQIWEILAQVRKENIKDDIEIAILQIEYNKAEDAAKFFKGYLKQKQSFTEMISKALENSIQRYKTRQILQEYQVVLPMGMVEVDVGWEQDAKMPSYVDLIVMPGEDYAKLLTERHEAEVTLANQQWKNGVTLNNISKLNSRHYELIARNKLLSLNIKHIERYQPSIHSRSLIKEIKESGLRLGSEKTTKRSGPSVSIEGESRTKREEEEEILLEDDDQKPPSTGKHFILSDAQTYVEEYPELPDETYPKAVIQVNPSKIKNKRKSKGRRKVSISKDDIYEEKPYKYLFDEDYLFSIGSEVDYDDGSMTSIFSTVSKYSRFSKESIMSRISKMTGYLPLGSQPSEYVGEPVKSVDIRTLSRTPGTDDDDEDDEDEDEEDEIELAEEKEKKPGIRKTRKPSIVISSVLKKSLTKIRAYLKAKYLKKITNENSEILKGFLENIEDNMKIYMWRGMQTVPYIQLDNIDKFNISDEELDKERSEFQLIKDNYIREAKISIKRNNEIWYPKLSARDAELFKKDTGIDFDKYLEIPKEVVEVYDYDAKAGDISKSEEHILAPSQSTEQVSLEYFERKKREFAFTGSWPERLIALWKELEGAEQATKQLEKLIRKSKKPSITDYWNYSDFNFKRHMKNNLVSLLKSYKNQVERYWKDSKAMEREMTRYVEMNKKCVLLFFNYELEQSKCKDGGAQLEEMSKLAATFSSKRNIKVEKAMKKAQLLREVQKNQYEILQLQSELELLQLRTYPILMYTHV